MAYTLLGKNFTPADVEPKITGRAKYAEDFRVESNLIGPCRSVLLDLERPPQQNGGLELIGRD
ncbi:MAG: hypothetical protein VCC36_08560, partial [Gammaproteobacteria bacterium]|jgi:hypothetical protein